MTFIAASVGPFLSKLLKDSLGPVYVFGFCLLCHVVVIVYCYFLKEPSTTNERELSFSFTELFSFKPIVDSIKTVFCTRKDKARMFLLLELTALFITINVIVGEIDITYIFLANINASHVFEYFFGLKNAFSAIGLIAVLPLLKYYQVSDLWITIIGLVSFIVGAITFALSNSVAMVFVAGLLAMGARIADATLRSLVSQNVEQHEIGKIFGFVAVVGDLSLITGSQIFNGMYTPLYNQTGLPGMAFFIGALLLLLPLLLTFTVLIIKKNVVKTTVPNTNQYDNRAFKK